jgi:hypothetical protein
MSWRPVIFHDPALLAKFPRLNTLIRAREHPFKPTA